MFYAFNLKKLKKYIWFFFVLACIGSAGVISLVVIYPLKHLEVIERNAKEYGLSPAFVCAVIHAESKFEKEALSNKGARGLMQVTESTANWLAEKMTLDGYDYALINEPEINIKIGCYYLRSLLEKYEGDIELALAAYNAGGGNVKKWLDDPRYSQDGITLQYIPFKETRNYIQRVKLNTKVYEFMFRFI